MNTNDPLDCLRTFVREEAIKAAIEAVRAELLRERVAQVSGPRLLSLAKLGKRYGIGRGELKRLIAEGQLPCVERRCRGGRVGVFVAIEDGERILAGRRPGTSE